VTVNDSGQVVFERQAATRVGPLVFQRQDGVLVTFRENARKEITHMFVNQASFERIR
jgi:sorbitol-specific phosphotransferase system component IIA